MSPKKEKPSAPLERLKPPFSRSAETEALARTFTSLKYDEFISYDAVQKIIHENPRLTKGRGITQSARNVALRDEKVVIVCVPTKGFKRVSEAEKDEVATTHIGKIRRATRRASKIARSADLSKMDDTQRMKSTVTISWIGSMEIALRPSTAKKIERAIEASSDIKAGDILKLILSKQEPPKKEQ